MDENWIDYGIFDTYTTLQDSDNAIVIEDKEVKMTSENVIAQGDANSQMLTFITDRYREGVDLIGMDIAFYYTLPDREKTTCVSRAVNVKMTDDKIKFSWVVTDKATYYAGRLNCVISFIGTDENGDDYRFNTKAFIVKVCSSNNGTSGTAPIANNWYKADLSEYAKTSDIVNFVTASDVETLVNEKVGDAIVNGGISGGGTGNIATATNEEITTMFNTLKAKYF